MPIPQSEGESTCLFLLCFIGAGVAYALILTRKETFVWICAGCVAGFGLVCAINPLLAPVIGNGILAHNEEPVSGFLIAAACIAISAVIIRYRTDIINEIEDDLEKMR